MRDKIKLVLLTFAAVVAIAAELFCFAVTYAAVVIILRYDFGIELWPALHWPN